MMKIVMKIINNYIISLKYWFKILIIKYYIPHLIDPLIDLSLVILKRIHK